MVTNSNERREFKRALFTSRDGVIAVIEYEGAGRRTITSTVMNLGEGGLQFILKKDEAGTVSRGDVVTMRGIKGRRALDLKGGFSMEIRWVMDLDFLEYVGVGGAFLDMPDGDRGRLRKFIEREV